MHVWASIANLGGEGRIKIVLISIFVLIYSAFIFRIVVSLLSMNSDMAILILFADDILNGNFFLSGWISSGILFTFTELPFYIIGVLIHEVSNAAFQTAQALIFIALSMSALTLMICMNKNVNLTDVLVFLAFTGFSVTLQTHGGVYTYLFVICILLSLVLTLPSKKRYLVIMGVLFVLGTMSNSILILTGTIPIAFWVGFDVIRNGVKAGEERKRIRTVAFVSFVSTAVGVLLERLYVCVGQMVHNEVVFAGRWRLISIGSGQIWTNLEQYLLGLMRLSSADFSGVNIVSIDAMQLGLRFLYVVYGIVLAVRTLVCFFLGKKIDLISVVLALGLAFFSVMFIFTGMGGSATTIRYIPHAPFVFALLIVKHLKDNDYFSAHLKYVRKILLPGICVFLLSSVLLAPYSPTKGQHYDLGEFLYKNGLETGMATFWFAAVTTVNTEQRVHVTAVTIMNNGVEYWRYYTNTEWFLKEANFVIVQNEDEYNSIIYHLGEPGYLLQHGTHTIMVFDHDISPFFRN